MRYQYIFEVGDIGKLDFIPKVAFIFYKNKKRDIVLNLYHILKRTYQSIVCIGIDTFGVSFVKSKTYTVKNCDFVIVLYEDELEYITLWDDSNLDKISVKDRDKKYISFSSLTPDKSELAINNLNLKDMYGMVASESIFYQGNFLKDIILIINFKNYSINGLSTHDFETVKMNSKITKAKKNIIEEIEYIPAVKFMEDAVGVFNKSIIEEFRIPLILSDNKNKYNKYKLTSILSVDRKKNLIYTYRQVKEGMRMNIGVLTDKKESLKRKKRLKSISQNVNEQYILFACLGIEKFWKNLTDIRLIEISDILQHDLLCVFGNGEIGKPTKETNSMLLNQTYTLISIFERQKDGK